MIAQGAEAIITKENDAILKTRIAKSYRIQAIDNSLRKSRTKREAKILTTLKDFNIPAPKLIEMNDRDMTIKMSCIDGVKLRDVLDTNIHLAEQLGKLIAQLHNLDIIHGDLTTSNMIVNSQIHLIDFGLSFYSQKVEDKAVDLHLLRQALESKHYAVFTEAYREVISSYTQHSKNAKEVMNRLEKVEARGRNKAKY